MGKAVGLRLRFDDGFVADYEDATRRLDVFHVDNRRREKHGETQNEFKSLHWLFSFIKYRNDGAPDALGRRG